MRTFVTLGTVVALAMTTATPAHAQIWKRVQKKAEEAVTNKAEAKLDAKINEMAQKMVDNSFNTMFGDPAAGGDGSGGGGKFTLPFKIGSDVKTEDRYVFDIVTTYEMESFEPDGSSEGKALITSYHSKSGEYTGTKISDPEKKAEGEAIIIFDVKNQAMLMLLSSDDGKFRMGYDWSQAEQYAAQAAASAPPSKQEVQAAAADAEEMWHEFKKIGSRSIAGIDADGYRSETADGVSEVWVSHDKSIGGGGLFGANSSMKQMRGRVPEEYPTGMLLEVNGKDKDGSRFVMRATDINRNARTTIEMSDYPPVTMGGK